MVDIPKEGETCGFPGWKRTVELVVDLPWDFMKCFETDVFICWLLACLHGSFIKYCFVEVIYFRAAETDLHCP